MVLSLCGQVLASVDCECGLAVRGEDLGAGGDETLVVTGYTVRDVALVDDQAGGVGESDDSVVRHLGVALRDDGRLDRVGLQLPGGGFSFSAWPLR